MVVTKCTVFTAMERKASACWKQWCKFTGDSQHGLVNFPLTYPSCITFARSASNIESDFSLLLIHWAGKQNDTQIRAVPSVSNSMQWANPPRPPGGNTRYPQPSGGTGAGFSLRLLKMQSKALPALRSAVSTALQASWRLCSCGEQILWSKTKMHYFENNFI